SSDLRSRAVTVVLPAPFGPAMTSNTGFMCPFERPYASRTRRGPSGGRWQSSREAHAALALVRAEPRRTLSWRARSTARPSARSSDPRGRSSAPCLGEDVGRAGQQVGEADTDVQIETPRRRHVIPGTSLQLQLEGV